MASLNTLFILIYNLKQSVTVGKIYIIDILETEQIFQTQIIYIIFS